MDVARNELVPILFVCDAMRETQNTNSSEEQNLRNAIWMIEISEPNDVENCSIYQSSFTTMMHQVVVPRTVPVRAIMTRPTPSRTPSSTGKVKKPMSATEKIIARKSGSAVVSPGQNVWVNVDTLMTHDVCGPGTFGVFEKEFGKDAEVWDPNRVVLIPDHYIFTDDPRANRNVDMLRFSHFLTLFKLQTCI